MRIIVTLTVLFCIASISSASAKLKPIQWTYEAKRTAPNEYDLIFKATIDKKWHLYSQFLESDNGPVKTTFTFKGTEGFEKSGIVKEQSKIHTDYDKNFGIKLKYFEKEAIFVQHIKLTKDMKNITGTINYMSCNDIMCLPPADETFTFAVKYEEVKK